MKITVVGLGKIGLPLAVQYASRGHQVIGADINQRVVDQVNRGEEPFPGEADLASKLASAVQDGLITATVISRKPESSCWADHTAAESQESGLFRYIHNCA